MKTGQILSKNRELERYLTTIGHEDDGSASRGHTEVNKSSVFPGSREWRTGLFSCAISGLWCMMARNMLFICFFYSSRCRRYLLSHGIHLDVHISPAEVLLQWIAVIALMILSYYTLPLFISCRFMILLMFFLVFPALCGLILAYLFNTTSLLFCRSYEVSVVTLKLLQKLQISLLGRDLLYPLPPYFKYEEYLARQLDRSDGMSLSVPALRKTLHLSLNRLRTTLENSFSVRFNNAENSWNGGSYQDGRGHNRNDSFNLTLLALHDMSQLLFQQLAPKTLASLYNSFISSLLAHALSVETLSQFFKILSTLMTVKYSISYFHESLSSLTLPSASYPLYEVERAQFGDIDDTLFTQYARIRKTIFAIKAKYESNLQRLWFTEMELANLFPLLTSQKPESLADSMERALIYLRGGDPQDSSQPGKEWEVIFQSELDDLSRFVEEFYLQIPISAKLEIQRTPSNSNFPSSASVTPSHDQLNDMFDRANVESEKRSQLSRLKSLYMSDEGNLAPQIDPQSETKDDQTIIVHTGRVLSDLELSNDVMNNPILSNQTYEHQLAVARKLVMKELLPQVKVISEKSSEKEREKWIDGRDESFLIQPHKHTDPSSPTDTQANVYSSNTAPSNKVLFASLLRQSIPSTRSSQQLEEVSLGDIIDDEN